MVELVWAKKFLTNLQCASNNKFSIKIKHVSVSQIAARKYSRNQMKMQVKPAMKIAKRYSFKVEHFLTVLAARLARFSPLIQFQWLMSIGCILLVTVTDQPRQFVVSTFLAFSVSMPKTLHVTCVQMHVLSACIRKTFQSCSAL